MAAGGGGGWRRRVVEEETGGPLEMGSKLQQSIPSLLTKLQGAQQRSSDRAPQGSRKPHPEPCCSTLAHSVTPDDTGAP